MAPILCSLIIIIQKKKMNFGKEEENETVQKEENELDTVVQSISNLNHFLQPGIT